MLLCCVLLLGALSIPLIDSATHSGSDHYFARRQVTWLLLSVCALCLGAFVNYGDLVNLSPFLYALNIVLLIVTAVVGKEVNGARRWIALGFFDLQPSEMIKVTVILLSAWLLTRSPDPPDSLWEFALFYGWILVPALLIARQPDLGSALILIVTATGALYFSGASGGRILGLGLTAVALVALVIVLHLYAGLPLPIEQHWIDRMVTLVKPHDDPLGTGYQVLQSRIAIGSGTLWGKGLRQGTQNRLDFIPFQHTDFIFSVVGEELGFIKTLLVLGIYLVVLFRCLTAAVSAADRRGTIVAGGVLTMLLFHVLVNLGMTMGIMPVTGVPLPFLSYGGNAILADSFAVGLVLNVGWQRHKILF